ncbi:MAG: hypothetical protein ACXW4M_11545 [Anaerolineales bacterium]
MYILILAANRHIWSWGQKPPIRALDLVGASNPPARDLGFS